MTYTSFVTTGKEPKKNEKFIAQHDLDDDLMIPYEEQKTIPIIIPEAMA